MLNKEVADPFLLLVEMERAVRSTAKSLPRPAVKQQQSGIGFKLQDYYFVVPLQGFVEVLSYVSVTPLPRVKPWLHGLINVRGNLMSVIDLTGYLNLGKINPSPKARVLILQGNNLKCGLLIEQIFGLQLFSTTEEHNDLSSLPASCLPYVTGGFRQEGQTWFIFSTQNLFNHQSFYQIGCE